MDIYRFRTILYNVIIYYKKSKVQHDMSRAFRWPFKAKAERAKAKLQSRASDYHFLTAVLSLNNETKTKRGPAVERGLVPAYFRIITGQLRPLGCTGLFLVTDPILMLQQQQ